MSEKELKGGCNKCGPYEVCGHTTENCPKFEENGGGGTESKERKVEKKTVSLGYCDIEADVSIDDDGNVRFEGNLEKEDIGLLTEEELKVLFEAGVLNKKKDRDVSYFEEKPYKEGEEGHCSYSLSEEGFSGWVYIKKEVLNRALEEGRLIAKVDEEEEIELSVGQK